MSHASLFHIDPFSSSSSKLALLYRHRRGRKTETSSDASQEAPERARKDTPEEARLLLGGSAFSVRLYKRSFSGFLATLPMAAGGGHAGRVTLPLRGKSVLPQRFGSLHFALACLVYHKIRPTGGKSRRRRMAHAHFFRRRPPGLSQPDAPCEHPDIRARAENLTTRFQESAAVGRPSGFAIIAVPARVRPSRQGLPPPSHAVSP